MANTNLYLDTRVAKKDGSFPLKIMLRHAGSIVSIPVQMSFTPEEWQTISGMIPMATYCKDARVKRVSTIKTQVETALATIRLACDMDNMTAAQIKESILVYLGRPLPEKSKSETSKLFLSRFNRFMETRSTAGTKKAYLETIRKIEAFSASAAKLRFEDINKDWLTDFDRFLQKTAGAASRHKHLRNIKAVFNDAIDNEVTSAYPFRKFKMPRLQPTRKRAMTLEQLKAIRDYKVEPWQEEYRDMFMLMFYLIGINSVDLFSASAAQLVNGRLEYTRQKTHKLYSIKVEPEAMALIKKYRGENHLLLPLDRYQSAQDYLHHMNDALQKIGPQEIVPDKAGKKRKVVYHPLFPDITSYWTRHTWATLAAGEDIPIETISRALGHSVGSDVTNIYIRFDERKIDKANRKVLDLLK